VRWIHERFRALGYDNTYRLVPYGPVDFFFLDSSTPLVTGERSGEQLAWLDEQLGESTALWKIAVLHHAPYSSSAKRGSNLELRAAVEPLLIKHGVQLALTGHDHTYERTTPQGGVTYVVTGAGAKLGDVGRSDFTAASAKILEFLMIEVDGDRLNLRAIDKTGVVFDEVTLDASGEVVP
jgi:hypothetical protein